MESVSLMLGYLAARTPMKEAGGGGGGGGIVDRTLQTQTGFAVQDVFQCNLVGLVLGLHLEPRTKLSFSEIHFHC